MKVVWLCHVVNEDLKKYYKSNDAKEVSPWINNLIKLFTNQTNFEIYIVSPNLIKNEFLRLDIGNIHYIFFPTCPRFIKRAFYNKLKIDLFTNYCYTKKVVSKIIEGIQPDIIHLHGAENPYYSSSILCLSGKYPIFLTIQGFVLNSTQRNFEIQKRIKIEKEVIKFSQYIGTRTGEMNEIVKAINPKAKIFFHNYPLTIPMYVKDYAKPDDFDLVYFARITKDKGIEDLIKAMSLVVKINKDVKLKVIGAASKKYTIFINEMVYCEGLQNNIEFLGFKETQQEIFEIASKAKICVLPTFHDVVPGTIIESMFMKLPVISYAVGGIPELNENLEVIRLVSRGSIEKLSEAIIDLLNNRTKRMMLAEAAFEVGLSRYDNKQVLIDLSNAYNKIRDNCKDD